MTFWRDWAQQYRYAKKRGILNHPLVIAWRFLWAGPYYATLILLCLIAAAGWGGEKAHDTWTQNR